MRSIFTINKTTHLLLSTLIYLHVSSINATLFFGCSYQGELCDADESCVNDGLLGQCQASPVSAPIVDVNGILDTDDLRLIGSELSRLVENGYTWRHARTQCTIAYFMFTVRYDLAYDQQFCVTQHPENIWALLHAIQGHLSSAIAEQQSKIAIPVDVETNDVEPEIIIDTDSIVNSKHAILNNIVQQMLTAENDAASDIDLGYAVAPPPALVPLADIGDIADGSHDYVVVEDMPVLINVPDEQYDDANNLDNSNIEQETVANTYDNANNVQAGSVTVPVMKKDIVGPIVDMRQDDNMLNDKEEEMLNEMLDQVMNGYNPDLSRLSDRQLDKFIAYVEMMQDLLVSKDTIGEPSSDIDMEAVKRQPEVADLNDFESSADLMLLKKDLENIGDTRMGLDNTEHKIVKGTTVPKKGPEAPSHKIHRIDGERVYVKLNKNFEFEQNEAHLIDLMNYLEKTIARPKNLTFSDFSVSGNQLSFRVTPLQPKLDYALAFDENLGVVPVVHEKREFSLATDVADTVFKRKQDVLQVSGASVLETAVGNVDDHVRVSPSRDTLALPIMFVCGTLVAVLSVLGGAYVYNNRLRANRAVGRLAADIEARPAKTYEELCRQRMSSRQDGGAAEPLSGVVGTVAKRLGSQTESPTARHSSSSSWTDEPASGTAMDINTGHMILSYMEEHLENKDKLSEDWAALCAYLPDKTDTSVARSLINELKNRDSGVVPYDHNRVKLQSLIDMDDTGYINASVLYDALPSQPEYIATQAPLQNTTDDFWQMVWEQGSVVIVNITRVNENGDAKCHRYWPENGSKVYGIFEVHLVSEHIWCEDYVVRSFYLKNLRTAETRTVTQFHYVNWPDHGVPSTTKTLMEFRRKVNKSYRGKCSPIVVHCNNGAGRTGTYCLIDMVINRISKGIKQLDVAATLEHLRDQRMSLVDNIQQYEFVLACIADETHAILKAIAH